MTSLFHKIRKQLAEDNKPIKYLRYAIGEIILIVVGILIAININNWNDERKTKTVTKDYLKSIKDDLIADTISIRRQDSVRAGWNQRIGNYYKYFNKREWTNQEVVDSCKRTSFEIGIYLPINNTYNDMLSSGKTGLLHDNIRNALSELKKEQDALVQINKSVNSMLLKNVHEVENYWEMENSSFFKNSISKYRKLINFYDNEKFSNSDHNLILGLKYHHNIFNWMYHINDIKTTIGNSIVLKSNEIIILINKELNN